MTPEVVTAQRPFATPLILDPPAAQSFIMDQSTEKTRATFDLLPNWEVGRNACIPLPNYEPGAAQFLLLDQLACPRNLSEERKPSALPSIGPIASPSAEKAHVSLAIRDRYVDSSPRK